MIDTFVLDRGHKNGKEVHKITDNGIVLIYNQKSNKLITKLIANPRQLDRYYLTNNRQVPKTLRDIAVWHEELLYNYY